MSNRIVSLLACFMLALVTAGWRYSQACRSNQPALEVGIPAPYETRPAVHLALESVWPRAGGQQQLGQLGNGKGIVFSPDLSEPGNRAFYRALGFAYFEDPSWLFVLDQIKAFNQGHPDNRIKVLFIQSHGTNGDALKLQMGKESEARRSYISLGALQERLAEAHVRVCLLGACNAGRLARPEHYRTVNPDRSNRLFEPATLGIVNASPNFDPSQSSVVIGRRAESHIEVVNEWYFSELAPRTRAALRHSGGPVLRATNRIAIPEMLIQLLLNDDKLHLLSSGYEVNKSGQETNDYEREKLINRFLRFLNATAVAEVSSQKSEITTQKSD